MKEEFPVSVVDFILGSGIMESFRERCFVGAQIAAILYECGLTLMQVEQVLVKSGYSLDRIGLSQYLISDRPELKKISEFSLINGHVHAPMEIKKKYKLVIQEITTYLKKHCQ